ncbi:WD40-repeat-containing domain protein [Aspergillus ambiguus]|uniref:WD40 repeat domain-containing protein n=1 Tax=Aspergillus ambiguus TaxID=176160 RepID=UPI003CCDCECB
MAHPDLTSHHVNYLIWSFLGHGEAAVTLQRAWNRDPQSLPFAPYIKTHALVSLVQKGLQYYELEQSLDKDGNRTPFPPSNYFFGPAALEPEPPKSLAETGVGTDQPPVSPTNKVARDGAAINGHLATAEAPPNGKKSRKSDRGEPNGDDAPMEVDTNGLPEPKSPEPAVDADGDVSMGTRPESQEPPPPPPPTFTLTNGQSIGVQITPAKAADLSPNTAILQVAHDDHVTRTLWRPRDPTVVAAAGDSSCSLWKLSSSAAPVQEKLVTSRGDGACVSAVAWDPTGQKLAVATYNEMRGSVAMYDVAGNAVDLLPEVPRMITGLHWAENRPHLIVVASDTKVSELVLWDDSLRPDEFPPPQVIDGSVYDLSWLGRNQAFACGNGSVYQCEVDTSINLTKTYTSGGPDKPWSFIRCTHAGPASVAVTASSSERELWIPTHDMHLEAAHEGEITAIELKPNAFDPTQAHPPLVLASASTDDTVKIWHVDLESKRFECIHRLFLGPSAPALAGCFSPDGYAVAAASKDKLFIWNAQRGGPPMATWSVPGADETKQEEVNGHNGHVDSIPDRSLSWDTDGKKLAFGFGGQLAIVNMQR